MVNGTAVLAMPVNQAALAMVPMAVNQMAERNALVGPEDTGGGTVLLMHLTQMM